MAVVGHEPLLFRFQKAVPKAKTDKPEKPKGPVEKLCLDSKRSQVSTGEHAAAAASALHRAALRNSWKHGRACVHMGGWSLQAINILLSKLPSVEELQECIANFDEDKLNSEAIEMLFKNQPTAEARSTELRKHTCARARVRAYLRVIEKGVL